MLRARGLRSGLHHSQPQRRILAGCRERRIACLGLRHAFLKAGDAREPYYVKDAT